MYSIDGMGRHTIELSLSDEEKKKLLKALEEDIEFRYAVMGLLGYKEVLERITKIEERLAKIEERQQVLEERFVELEKRFAELEGRQLRLEERFAELEKRFAELEERFARIEERQQKLEEKFIELEKRFAELEERFTKLEERQQRLEERQQRIEERMTRVLEELRDLRRVVVVIAHRFGVLSESAFREAMKYVIEESLGVGRVYKKSLRDDEGLVYGYPSIIDIDVVIRDEKHILVEVKSRVSRSDVRELYLIGKLYEKIEGVKPELIIIGGFIDPEAYEAAAKFGVIIKPALREE